MKDDLTGIKDSASEDQGGEIPGVALTKRRINGMIEQWNTLNTAGKLWQAIVKSCLLLTIVVEYFEKVAIVSEPEYITIKEYIKKFSTKNA